MGFRRRTGEPHFGLFGDLLTVRFLFWVFLVVSFWSSLIRLTPPLPPPPAVLVGPGSLVLFLILIRNAKISSSGEREREALHYTPDRCQPACAVVLPRMSELGGVQMKERAELMGVCARPSERLKERGSCARAFLVCVLLVLSSAEVLCDGW